MLKLIFKIDMRKEDFVLLRPVLFRDTKHPKPGKVFKNERSKWQSYSFDNIKTRFSLVLIISTNS